MRFALLVRKPNGRRWYRADSASTGDPALAAMLLEGAQADHPQFLWTTGTSEPLDGYETMPADQRIAPAEITAAWS